MPSEDVKKKPKHPETIFGTNCMGENWTVCCPNFHLKFDRYAQTKRVTQIKYKGGIYRIFFCSPNCEKNIKNNAFTSPEIFKKQFIKGFKPNGDMIIKHKDTNIPCQIAVKVDTYSDSKGADDKTAKQKGGSGYRRTRRNKKYSKSVSKSRFSKSRRNKTMRR